MAGLLALIRAGRLDPLDTRLDEEREPGFRQLNGADRRARDRMNARRAKKAAVRAGLPDRRPF